MDPNVQQAIAEVRNELLERLRQMDEKGTAAQQLQQQQQVLNEVWKKKLEEIDKALMNMTEVGEGKKNSNKFNHKDAQQARPGSWDDTTPFMDLMLEIKTWADALHDNFEELLDKA